MGIYDSGTACPVFIAIVSKLFELSESFVILDELVVSTSKVRPKSGSGREVATLSCP